MMWCSFALQLNRRSCGKTGGNVSRSCVLRINTSTTNHPGSVPFFCCCCCSPFAAAAAAAAAAFAAAAAAAVLSFASIDLPAVRVALVAAVATAASAALVAAFAAAAAESLSAAAVAALSLQLGEETEWGRLRLHPLAQLWRLLQRSGDALQVPAAAAAAAAAGGGCICSCCCVSFWCLRFRTEGARLPARANGLGGPRERPAAAGKPVLLLLLLLLLLLVLLLLLLLLVLLLLHAHFPVSSVVSHQEVHETLKAVERLWLRLHSLC